MARQATSSSALRRVFLVSWWFADFGGMERHITELAKALHGRGINVTVFTEMPVPRKNQYRRELRQAGISFVAPPIPRNLTLWWQRRFPASGQNTTSSDIVENAMGAGFLARLLKSKLERRLRRVTPDVVHVHGWRLRQWVVTWCASRGVPAVFTEHSTISDWGGPEIADAPRSIAKCAAVACVSEAARASLASWLPHHSIAIHRHIVRLPDAAPSHQPSAPVRVLAVARLRAEKGLDILLRAAAELFHRGIGFQLEIAGSGPMLTELRALARELHLNGSVEFSGLASAHAIHAKMRRADLFVLPSRTEALPLALLEAMSHGLAVVATAVGGIPEVILHGETGLLVPAESVDLLSSAMGRVVSDPAFRKQLGTNARRQFESGPYSEAAGADSVLASYEEVRNEVLAG